MADKSVKDEVGFITALLEREFWGVSYHERNLADAHKKYAIVKSVFIGVFPDVTEETAIRRYEDNPDDESCDGPADYVARQLGEAHDNIRFHEEKLTEAHVSIAKLKAVVLRTDFSSMIDFKAVAATAKKREEGQS